MCNTTTVDWESYWWRGNINLHCIIVCCVLVVIKSECFIELRLSSTSCSVPQSQLSLQMRGLSWCGWWRPDVDGHGTHLFFLHKNRELQCGFTNTHEPHSNGICVTVTSDRVKYLSAFALEAVLKSHAWIFLFTTILVLIPLWKEHRKMTWQLYFASC